VASSCKEPFKIDRKFCSAILELKCILLKLDGLKTHPTDTV